MRSEWFERNILRCEGERERARSEADRRIWGDAIEVYLHLQNCPLRHGKVGDPLSPNCEEKYE